MGSVVNGWVYVFVMLDYFFELVMFDNVKDYVVGEVIFCVWIDGEWFEFEWMVKDSVGIEVLDIIYFEVFGGYIVDIDFMFGVMVDGCFYDGV